jgi:hypothetical protein
MTGSPVYARATERGPWVLIGTTDDFPGGSPVLDGAGPINRPDPARHIIDGRHFPRDLTKALNHCRAVVGHPEIADVVAFYDARLSHHYGERWPERADALFMLVDS